MLRNALRSRALLSQRAAAMNAAKPSVARPAVRSYSTQSNKQAGGGNTPSVPAMLAVASMGFAAYHVLVKSREGQRNMACVDPLRELC